MSFFKISKAGPNQKTEVFQNEANSSIIFKHLSKWFELSMCVVARTITIHYRDFGIRFLTVNYNLSMQKKTHKSRYVCH